MIVISEDGFREQFLLSECHLIPFCIQDNCNYHHATAHPADPVLLPHPPYQFLLGHDLDDHSAQEDPEGGRSPLVGCVNAHQTYQLESVAQVVQEGHYYCQGQGERAEDGGDGRKVEGMAGSS